MTDFSKMSDAELIAKADQLERIDRQYREDNRILFFDSIGMPGPNPRQAEILDAWEDVCYRTFTITGGNRLGKTTILTLIAIATLRGEYPWDHKNSRKARPTKITHLFPHNQPRKIRYIGQDWKEHIQDVVIPELKKWWPKEWKVKRRGNGIIRDTEWIDEKTGSELNILSNRQDPGVHEGWAGDLIIYDEPPRRDIYIANARGLVDREGREFIAATLLGEPWIHKDIINKKLPDGKPDPTVYNVQAESSVNVGYGISQKGLDEFASKLTEQEFKARIKGIPSYMEGLVYPDYKGSYKDKGGHLCQRFDIPTDWPVDVAIDYHPREKQALLFTAVDDRNEKYACEEIWDNGDAEWIADCLIRRREIYRYSTIIVDPLAKGDKNNQNTAFDRIAAKLAPYGLVIQVASKDKPTGILDVKRHLKGPNNTPSMWFFDDLVNTIREIEGYMWDKDTGKPVDKDDHMMENLYRTMLLGTKYIPLEDANSEDEMAIREAQDNTRSAMTGY